MEQGVVISPLQSLGKLLHTSFILENKIITIFIAGFADRVYYESEIGLTRVVEKKRHFAARLAQGNNINWRTCLTLDGPIAKLGTSGHAGLPSPDPE